MLTLKGCLLIALCLSLMQGVLLRPVPT